VWVNSPLDLYGIRLSNNAHYSYSKILSGEAVVALFCPKMLPRLTITESPQTESSSSLTWNISGYHIHISALLICCGKRVDKFTYTHNVNEKFCKKNIWQWRKTSSHYILQVGMAHIWFCLTLTRTAFERKLCVILIMFF